MKDRIKELMESKGMEVLSQAQNHPRWDSERLQAYNEEVKEKRSRSMDVTPVESFSYEQVQRMMKEMLSEMMEGNKQSMVEFAKELRKPSEEEESKRIEAKLRREKLMQSMIESAVAEQKNRDMIQSACNHKKPNGIINFGGQVHGNRVRLICKTCFKELVNRVATPEDIQGGPLELAIENQRMGLNV